MSNAKAWHPALHRLLKEQKRKLALPKNVKKRRPAATVDALSHLIVRLAEEVDEVRNLVDELVFGNPDDVLTEQVLAECADVANFAAMVAQVHREYVQRRSRKRAAGGGAT